LDSPRLGKLSRERLTGRWLKPECGELRPNERPRSLKPSGRVKHASHLPKPQGLLAPGCAACHGIRQNPERVAVRAVRQSRRQNLKRGLSVVHQEQGDMLLRKPLASRHSDGPRTGKHDCPQPMRARQINRVTSQESALANGKPGARSVEKQNAAEKRCNRPQA
jgi:hypothetical protein